MIIRCLGFYYRVSSTPDDTELLEGACRACRGKRVSPGVWIFWRTRFKSANALETALRDVAYAAT